MYYFYRKKKYGRQILSTDLIVNLKTKKFITIKHACKHPQSITCKDKLADAHKKIKTSTILKFNLLPHESLTKNGKCKTLMKSSS